MQPAMPLVLPVVFSVLFGIGLWQVGKHKSWRIALSGFVDWMVKGLGFGAVLVGVLSIALMLVASWYRLF